VEAGEALNSISDAKLHMKGLQKGYRIRHILEIEERKKAEAGLVLNLNKKVFLL